MSIIIGLTGSIATGKSTVSLMFDDFNIPVIDADKVAREVVKPGELAYKQIVNQFGHQILRADKTLNREMLGQIVFADEAKRDQLNKIIHPAVREKIIEKRDAYLQAKAPCVVLDIPLLYENNLTYLVDKTIVVYADEDVQLRRLMERNGYTEQEANQRMQAQMPVKEKAKKADAVIDNNGSKYKTYKQLEKILMAWGVIT
ncbi:dephospho-CoA kinase [Virgibacillus proomii]|uniref:dephospho-CoA kinase n=1 Tax=Virgibacillus proomii TaxID=84407 RepID=UPI001C103E0C|nr:dephospho-CoA kinase [Virgibacillus proomii]MBU5265604.1 dephospho-CoA kinase [Virgibacillus proomii]